MALQKIAIRQEGDRVLLIIPSKGWVLDLSYQEAVNVGRGLIAKGRLAEEQAKADQIIADNAILLRAGASFGLSKNPDIQAETVKEALYNRDLRRYLPGGIKSGEVVGTPTVLHGRKKNGKSK